MGGRFRIGKSYSRGDVKRRLGLPAKGPLAFWQSGYVRHRGEWFIFANVGVPGRTGHDYDNRWRGTTFVWWGNLSSHADQPSIKRILTRGTKIHIFTRRDNKAPFRYAGLGRVQLS